MVIGVVGGSCSYSESCDLCENCSVCPSSWSNQWNGQCYRTTSSADTWVNTRTTCTGWGGDLVRLDNQTEYNFITATYGQAWIGYNDQDNNNVWTWTLNGAGWVNWQTNVGIAQQGECAVMNDDGTYINKTCTLTSYTGICEINATCGAVSGGIEDIPNACYDATGCSATSGDYCRCFGDASCLTVNGGACTVDSNCLGFCSDNGVCQNCSRRANFTEFTGATTNFNITANIENISNATLEVPSYGKIVWNNSINAC